MWRGHPIYLEKVEGVPPPCISRMWRRLPIYLKKVPGVAPHPTFQTGGRWQIHREIIHHMILLHYSILLQ